MENERYNIETVQREAEIIEKKAHEISGLDTPGAEHFERAEKIVDEEQKGFGWKTRIENIFEKQLEAVDIVDLTPELINELKERFNALIAEDESKVENLKQTVLNLRNIIEADRNGNFVWDKANREISEYSKYIFSKNIFESKLYFIIQESRKENKSWKDWSDFLFKITKNAGKIDALATKILKSLLDDDQYKGEREIREKLEEDSKKYFYDVREIVKKHETVEEKQVLEKIKNMVTNEQLGMHFSKNLLNALIKMDDAPEAEEKELWQEKRRLILGKLKNYFAVGIFSEAKGTRWIHEERWPDNKLFDKEKLLGWSSGTSIQSEHLTERTWILQVINEYIENCLKNGIELNEIKFDKMVNDPEFDDLLKQKLLEKYNKNVTNTTTIDSSSGKILPKIDLATFKEKEMPWIKYMLKSQRTKAVFRELKNPNWKDKWKHKEEYIYWIANTYFGRNLISTYGPGQLKKSLSHREELPEPSYDSFAILFKFPKEMSTHLLAGKIDKFGDIQNSNDIGVANKIAPSKYVAVLIRKTVSELPDDFFEVIPENLPIIYSDMRIVRRPKKN